MLLPEGEILEYPGRGSRRGASCVAAYGRYPAGVHIWKDASGRNRNNLPKASESRVAHVRPHGKDSMDTAPLPTGGSMTKQCFWLNNRYVREQIED